MAKRKGTRGSHTNNLPRIRQLEEIAAAAGYEPGKVALLFFSDNQKKIMSWYEFLKEGRVPPDMSCRLNEAWDRFYKEAADFMATEERWMEYFHGKRQRIEQQSSVEVTKRVVSGEPLTEDEWQRKYSVEAPGGTTKGSD